MKRLPSLVPARRALLQPTPLVCPKSSTASTSAASEPGPSTSPPPPPRSESPLQLKPKRKPPPKPFKFSPKPSITPKPPPPSPPPLKLKRRSTVKSPSTTKKSSFQTLLKATYDQFRAQKFLAQLQANQRGSGLGLRSEEWATGWGADVLAPPLRAGSEQSSSDEALPKRRLPPMHERRLPKKLVPVSSQTSVPERGFPPHHVPWLRQEEGYIRDVQNGEQSRTLSVLRDVQSPSEHKPISQLAHGLDRVLFNPGVHWLQDPRSRVYNFTPWLESIPKVNDFDFDRVTGFVKSSADTDLWTLAKQHGRMFTGSTSSLTGLLGHIYFLISGDKMVDTSSLTQAFVHQPATFTPGQRMPTSVILRFKEGVWSIDSDKAQELAEKNVLTWMGTMLEKFLTVPEREFKKLLRSAPPLGPDADRRREAYRYAMSEQFVMRSQLDSYDPRLPGTGVFDIKTRAAVPIRLDILNYEENSGYLIKKLTGPLESFEKEYYDLIRSAFLKYSFQARIGNMDGVLVAYHNTARLFGFQYVSLEEMEQRLYGTGNGARVFDKCVLLLERVLMDVVSIYGHRSIKCTFETRELSNELIIWVEPATWDESVEGRPWPIKQLGVRVSNFIDGTAVSGSTAIESDRPWVIRWTLIEAAFEEADIRRRLQGAYERQLRELNFPAGVETTEQMVKVWQSIDFGEEHAGSPSSPSPSPSPSTSPSDQTTSDKVASPSEIVTPTPTSTSTPTTFVNTLNFKPPDSIVLRLRQLAVRGREETLREAAEGKEKVVWGAPEGPHWVRDVQGGSGGGMLPGDSDGGEVYEEEGEVVVAGEEAQEKVVEAEERVDRSRWSYYM